MTAGASVYQSRLDEARAEIERLERLVYVPGLWRCAKCNCQLISTTLHVRSGGMSADKSPQECPNKCGPMWRVTERDAGNRVCDDMDKLIADREVMREQLAAAEAARDLAIKGETEAQNKLAQAQDTISQLVNVRRHELTASVEEAVSAFSTGCLLDVRNAALTSNGGQKDG